MTDILTQALAAGTICKALVDMLRQAHPIPGWLTPPLALAFGILASFLLLLANGHPLTAQSLAQAVLAGVLAAASAVGVTELQKRTQ